MADDPNQHPYVSDQYEVLAWLAALLGDRPLALAMLRRAGESPTIGMYPEGVEAVQLACTSAAVYGFLGDAEAMMPFARRCFTSVNGYPIAYLNDPEFAWRKNDPRMKRSRRGREGGSLLTAVGRTEARGLSASIIAD